MNRRPLAAALLAVLALAATASCTSGPRAADAPGTAQSDYDRYAGLTGQERRDALAADAKKEGSVSIYTSNTNLQDDIVPAFEKKYGISVTLYRGTNEEVTQRTLQEAQSGRPGNDLVEGDASNMDQLGQSGAITPYKSEIRDAMPPEAQFDTWTAARYTDTIVIRNKNLVPDTAAPTRFQDLADPRWAGRLALESTDSEWYMTLHDYFAKQGMSDDQFTSMFRAIVKNAKVINGHPTLQSLLESGDQAVSVDGYVHTAVQHQEKGAPTSFVPVVGPVFRSPLGVALMKNAPHPAAAVLFEDFYLTDGQKIIADEGRGPANPSAVPGYRAPWPDGTTTLVLNEKKVLEEGSRWADAYDRLLKGQDNVLPSP